VLLGEMQHREPRAPYCSEEEEMKSVVHVLLKYLGKSEYGRCMLADLDLAPSRLFSPLETYNLTLTAPGHPHPELVY